jgi:hypothetical protein
MIAEQSPSQIKQKIIRPLQALNFFMADMQAGVGPWFGFFFNWGRGASGPQAELNKKQSVLGERY